MFTNTLYDKTYDWLYSIWTGDPSSDEMSEAFTQCLQLLMANRTGTLIVDCRQLVEIQSLLAYLSISEEWRNEAKECGLMALIAIVPSVQLEDNKSTWLLANQENFRFQTVENLPQALKWLKENKIKNKKAA